MTSIVLAGVACFLVVFGIIVKTHARKPKQPEKWEKAQIMKRLLALSEREGMVQGQPSVPQNTTPRHRAAAAGASPSRSVRQA